MSKESAAERLVGELATLDVYQVVDRFLASEAKYSKELRILSELENRLQVHFKLEDYIINPDDINAIFGTTGSLYNFTRDLAERLNQKRFFGPEQFLLEIGDMLVRDIQFFKMYGQYNQDLKQSIEKYIYFYENNTKFKRWVDFNEVVYGLPSGSGFQRLLKLPQQHFPTYTVYLQSMVHALSRLSASHPATQSLSNALGKFVDVLDDISRKAENTMRINRVVEIQKLYFKDAAVLVEASRKWYRTSKIKIKDVKENKKQVDAILFLFNDCLVYATAAFFGGYNLVNVMSIAGLTIQPITTLQHSFKLSSSITNREWEIQCITNEKPDQARLENKETAERSYFSWLSALLKVYKLYYNIEDSSNPHPATNITAPTRAIHPEDMELMMKKKSCPNPRQIEKPSPVAPFAAQAECDKIAASRQANNPGAQKAVAVQTPVAPVATAAPTAPKLSVTVDTTANAAPIPTPRRPAPSIAVVKHMTDAEIWESFPEGTKLGAWEKVFSSSDDAFYYENLELQTTQWDEPQEFLDEFAVRRAANDEAYAEYQRQLAAQAAAPTPVAAPAIPPHTPARPAAVPPTAPPTTPAQPAAGPPSLPPATPAQPAAGPPSLPPATPAQPAAGPPSLPPATPAQPAAGPPSLPPATPAQPAAGPPSLPATSAQPAAGPPGMPVNPMRAALLGGISGGVQLKKAEEATPPSTPAGAPPRGGLMGAISGGVQLKKVDPVESKPAAPAQGAGGISLQSNLMNSLQNYRKFVADDDDNDSDDDEW